MRVVSLLAVLAVLGCGDGTAPESPGDTTTPPVSSPPGWKAFTVAQVDAQRVANGGGFHEFLTEPTLRAGLYHLGIGAADGQEAHGEDEIYYVAAGSGLLSIDGTDHRAEAGSVFYVRAGVDHHFHSITEALDVLVVFRRGAVASSGPAGLAFTAAETTAGRSGATNVWDLFMSAPTLSMGMYMLPMSLGGDGALTHTFDEINFVVAGSGEFRVDETAIPIGPGSIVYVERGRPHAFQNLAGDVDVLILWQR